jgi:uncharacterized protein YrrD
MDTQLEVVRQSDVLNRLVLDKRTTEEVGRVEKLWLNPQSHQVIGLTCKSGFLGNKKYSFSWRQIETIGADSILVNYDLETMEPEKPDLFSLIGHEVWTDAGNKVGKIVDFLFLPQTGDVVEYLFMSSGWRGVLDGIYLLAPLTITSVGSKRVIVPDEVVQEPLQYTEGLNQRFSQAAEFLKDDVKRTHLDWQAVKRNAQSISEQVKEKTQNLSSIAKEKTQNLTSIAKEKLAEVTSPPQDNSVEVVKTIDVKAEALPSTADLAELHLPNHSEISDSHQ